MLDGLALHERGVKTVVVVWEIFRLAATALAEARGVPDLPILAVPTPPSGSPDELHRTMAFDSVAPLLRLWRMTDD